MRSFLTVLLVLASGIVGGEAVQVPAGNHTVRIKGRANASKPAAVSRRKLRTSSSSYLALSRSTSTSWPGRSADSGLPVLPANCPVHRFRSL